MQNKIDILNNKRGYLKEDFLFFHLKDQKTMQFEFHHHDFNKIIILISGNVTYLIEGKTYKLKPWDVLLINSNEIHMVSVESNEPYERIIMWVNSSFLQRHYANANDLLTCFHLVMETKNNLLRMNFEVLKNLKDLLKQIEEAFRSEEFGSYVLKNSLFLQFIVLINRQFILMDNRPTEDIEYDESISRILEYINKNLNMDLSIDTIASNFYMSKYYLMHKFKKQTGCTIHNYIMKKRLMLASYLIQDGKTITEVCSECGFEDYSNFLRAFKKMYGLAPKSYYKEKRV